MKIAETRPVKVLTMRQGTLYVEHEKATFHAFGADYEEFDNGAGTYPIAVVELPDGKVITPRADRIQFLDVPQGGV